MGIPLAVSTVCSFVPGLVRNSASPSPATSGRAEMVLLSYLKKLQIISCFILVSESILEDYRKEKLKGGLFFPPTTLRSKQPPMLTPTNRKQA
jgi:hypothetical protein